MPCRRRGLAKALLAGIIIGLRKSGADSVMLGTGSDNPAMLELARSTGFEEASRNIWFSKTIFRESAPRSDGRKSGG